MRDEKNYDREKTENRDRIYEYIKNNPGVHLRMIVKDLELAMGTTQHHLDILERSGKIRSRRVNLHRHYYGAEIPSDSSEIILAFLKHETSRDILIYLVEHPNPTQSDIVNFIHFSAPTISWHMSRLVEADIVLATRDGKSVRYNLKRNTREITDLLKLYHPTIWNKMLDRIADLFLELSSTSKQKEDTTG